MNDCSIDGCVRRVFFGGLCSRHYEEKRLVDAPPCSHSDCSGKAERVGMCNKHYRQHRLAIAPPCSVEGCGRPSFVGGHCQTHHKRIQRYGSLEADKRAHDRGARRRHPLYGHWRQHSRYQTLCREWHDDFWVMVAEVGERPSPAHVLRRFDVERPIGPGNWHWMGTIPTPATEAEYQREYRKRNPDAVRGYRLKRQYGITVADYNRMFEKQGGVCAICKKPESARGNHGTARELAVDHCHDTGKVRGLLCTGCNTAIGKLRVSDDTLRNASAYLRKKR